jgi:hypothetical protein
MGADVSTPPLLRLLTRLALGMAVLLLAVWLWSRICRFPSIPWNDIRLAPSIALTQGWPVYPTANSGTITTWMYGPLPVLYLTPASWADTAAGALQIAAWLTLALTLVPLALVCFLWPARDPGGDTPANRLAALLGCVAVWPALHYSTIFSDNLAIACGLLANLVLVRARNPGAFWLAAFVATAAMGCKQICLGIPVAQIVWLALVAGRTAALRHMGRCFVCGIVIGGALISGFGWEGLWFTLVKIPAGLGLVPDFAQRLLAVAPTMAIHLGVPLLTMLVARRLFTGPGLLPAVAWLCTLPLGFAGMLSLGGWTNSIHSFVLWLPPVMVGVLTAPLPGRLRGVPSLVTALAAVALATGRLTKETDLPLRPMIDDYRLAQQIAERHAEAVWFPLHPLVTLYSDRRYYHDEDGLYVRQLSRHHVSPEHAISQLPPRLQMMAFHSAWNDWGIARKMLPPQLHETMVGPWILRSGLIDHAAP